MFWKRKKYVYPPKKEDLTIGAPKVFSVAVPGGMSMEDWQSGGFSRFNHSIASVDIEYMGERIVFDKLTIKQVECLQALHECYTTHGVRRSVQINKNAKAKKSNNPK